MTFLKIAWFEYFRRIRSKWFIIGTFGMPVLILGISMFGGYLSGSGAGIESKYFGVITQIKHQIFLSHWAVVCIIQLTSSVNLCGRITVFRGRICRKDYLWPVVRI